MSLERYGWTPDFQQPSSGPASAVPGRVRLATVRKAQVYTADGTSDINLPRNLGPVAVGDWLLFAPEKRIATRVLPRRNALARNRPGQTAKRQILAANIDAVLVVNALDRPPSLRQIDRYLVCVIESGASPLIVLNKTDLCADVASAVAACRTRHPDIPAIATSTVDGSGLAELERHLPTNGTVALAGPSGAGKSSLVNALLETDHLTVGAVRDRDRRGKHTTTRRELIVHPRGWLLMDIPGIRELYPWSRTATVDAVFGDLSALAANCYYRDCRHQGEPGCAVGAAVDEGRVEDDKRDSYLELRKEQEDLARGMDMTKT